jgi:Xaa-Pro aminopeptidase
MLLCYQNLADEAVIGINPWCISVDSAQRYEHAFLKKHQTLFQLSSDMVDGVWKDRPLVEPRPVIVHPVEFAGRSVPEKIKELREKLVHEKATAIIITALDEVQYILLKLFNFKFFVGVTMVIISFIAQWFTLICCVMVA